MFATEVELDPYVYKEPSCLAILPIPSMLILAWSHQDRNHSRVNLSYTSCDDYWNGLEVLHRGNINLVEFRLVCREKPYYFQPDVRTVS